MARCITTFVLLILIEASVQAQPSPRQRLATAAMAQVGVTRIYDSSYRQLRYPNGDLPIERGVCADVIVRAFRKIGIDLQAAVHDDMKGHFRDYPQLWKLRGPDTNIDHRRVPNLMRYFSRHGKSLSVTGSFEPGDVVAWMLPSNLYHIGLVSNVRNDSGTAYLVVHNIGYGAQNEDVLHAFRIIGHYRW